MLPRDYHRQHYCKQNSLKLLDNRRTKQILDESLGGIRPAGKMRNGWENKTWKDVPTAQYQNQRAVTRQEWLEEEIWGVHAQERYEEPEEGEEWLQDCSGWGGGGTLEQETLKPGGVRSIGLEPMAWVVQYLVSMPYVMSQKRLAIATVKPFWLQPPKYKFSLPQNSWVQSCSAPLGGPPN